MKTRKKTCYLFVFDGFADYETAISTAGICKSDRYQLKTVAFRKDPVVSMSGLTVVPDVDFIATSDLADIDTDNTAMLILPGGRAWEHHRNEGITPLVAHCLLQGIPVAAICGATVFLAELGLLNRTVHTSNSMEYLTMHSSVYHGHALYRSSPSVRSEFLITANGTAATEFAQDVFEVLGITDEAKVNGWFQYFHREVA